MITAARPGGKDCDAVLMRENGLVHCKRQLYVPNDLGKRAPKSEHDCRTVGHFGQDKTLELVRRSFWWPEIRKGIIDYIQSCLTCQQARSFIDATESFFPSSSFTPLGCPFP